MSDEQEKNELDYAFNRELAYAFNKHADNVRNAVIEECAQAAEDIWSLNPQPVDMYSMAAAIAFAIRALKDRP